MATKETDKQAEQQKPQFVEDQQAPGYDNDASGWVRGEGKQCPYPNFDRHKGGR